MGRADDAPPEYSDLDRRPVRFAKGERACERYRRNHMYPDALEAKQRYQRDE
ncbi:MAG: hypothetical protein KTR19_04390 [Hyphomicrobiales bacterium]|nr:hypothetical protein [Hyphomicrobiales bacterium]